MTDERQDHEDDEQLQRLLKPLADDAAPPDREAIAKVVQTAGAVFENARAVRLVRSDDAMASVKSHIETNRPARRAQKVNPMFAFAKPLVVLAASIMVLIAAFVMPHDRAVGDVTLGTVLDQALAADTLQLKAVRDGEEADVWIQAGTRLRWEDAPEKYRIASGSRLWRVDESRDSVSRESNPWLQADRPEIDLLSLLGVNARTSSEFRSAKSVGRIEHAGTLCDIFQVESNVEGTRVLIRAFADAETHVLYSIAAWPSAAAIRTRPPVAELRLVARNVPYDEEKFAIGGALSEDGRIGKIVDSQGIVLLRPMTASRWTPIAGRMLVKPGDWLRTDVRGANAVQTELISGFQVILGPGSLLEVVRSAELRLHRGEVQVSGNEGAEKTLQLIARNDDPLTISAGETKHYRLDRDESFVEVVQKPLWLRGFEGTTSEESIGSLIASIDGRDVPLTVGFHKVKVEIRDQIARTTIEESFVNRTPSRLEGVFHFPLPQDASISGFGMWINGELIEADVVEKQRAREIYETILREKRDPGLLEWTGGNIFKARVFPIEPHSEKRIKIVYTQVLPLRANRYRYSYGLRSELLQKTPLRELSLEVLINSAIPLKTVECPTHTVRLQQTEHSARVEFNEQEYSPTRDFEVVCEIDSRQSDVVVIPHRRGDDGYFLAQVTPPSPDGDWQRDVLPDGAPLNVLLVCDTSGSMDSHNRELQEQFVASVLATLGPRDRFNIATCDVETQWKHEQSVEAGDESASAAFDWLAERRSLGWTDLDRMAESVLAKLQAASLLPRLGGEGARRADEGAVGDAGNDVAQSTPAPTPHPNPLPFGGERGQDGGETGQQTTHVIYIGDGIVTARDANAQAFVARLKRMTESLQRGTFHAVSVGSSFESGVLKSIAAIGGGSVRQIDGEQTPQRTASELLNEIAQPGLRNLTVEFRGVQVAAVYPETLPNLSAGTQQIIIGRYLPQGNDQSGEIIVTGERNGQTVRYASRITLKDAESGNSFIPRLWARAHLDNLLQQGSSKFIRDEIIALSEEFHIMTPYTSLLVLETDEDRERFGVKRRFLMRDGERFFADGSDSARFELLQEQMKAAGDWRLGLRHRVLSELSRLGRDSGLFQQVVPRLMEHAARQLRISDGTSYFDFGRSSGRAGSGPYGGRMGGIGGGGFSDEMLPMSGEISSPMVEAFGFNWLFESDGLPSSSQSNELRLGDTDTDMEGDRKKENFERADRQLMDFEEADWSMMPGEEEAFDFQMSRRASQPERMRARQAADKISFLSSSPLSMGGAMLQKSAIGYGSIDGGEFYGGPGYYINPQQYTQWVNELFPRVPAVPDAPTVPETTWSDEALAISRSLVRPVALESGGLRFVFNTASFDPRWDRRTGMSRQIKLYSPKRWLTFAESVGSQTIVHWCDGEIRGASSRAFRLGQKRRAGARDVSGFDDGARAYAALPLHHSFPKHNVEVQRPADGRIVLVLTPEDPNVKRQYTLTIDSIRSVLLEAVWQQDGKVTSKTVYSEYIGMAGCWWPQSVEQFDGDGKLTSSTKLTLEQLNDDAFDAQYAAEMPEPAVVQLLTLPAPSVKDAKVAAAGGRATFEQHLVLLLNESLVQNWNEVLKHLESLQQLADGKDGMNWIRMAVLQAARKNEEVRQLGIRRLTEIVEQTPTDEWFLANFTLSKLDQIVDRNEKLSLLDQITALVARQPDHAHVDRAVMQQQAAALSQLGRLPEAQELQKQLAESAPWELWAQTTYAQGFVTAGDYDAAYAWLRARLDNEPRYNAYERLQLRNSNAEFLRQQNQAERLVEFLAEWVAEEPSDQSAYDQYLSAMFLANRVEDADQQAQAWLDAGMQPAKLDPVSLARLNAAVAYALGDRYRLYMSWIDPAWLKPLEETARYFLQHEHHFDVASRIMAHHRFHDTDERDRLVAEAAQLLQASAGQLEVTMVSSYVSWVINSTDLRSEDWLAIAATLRTRWDAENDLPKRDSLAGSLVKIYRNYSADELLLPFLRQQIARAEAADPVDPNRVAGFVNQLFEQLLGGDWELEQLLGRDYWKDEEEAEALALLPRLSGAESTADRLAEQVAALHKFVDRMLESRFRADVKVLQAEGQPEELTRTELAAKYAEFRKSAEEGVAKRLSDEIAKLDDDEPEAANASLHGWLNIERMYLDMRLDRNQEEVIAQCWEILGEAPVAAAASDQAAGVDAAGIEAAKLQKLDELRRARTLVMVSNLAVRRSAPDGLADRVLRYIDAGIANGGDQSDVWKIRRLAMLVALDQPERIERDLREWIQRDEYPAPWQLMLGRIVAEQGKIDEAIRLFETVKRDEGSLPPADFAALSKWYLVTDRKDDYREARIDIFMLTEEWQISNWLNQQRQPWYRNDVPLPTELDENVLFAFQALFRKSNTPGQYAHQLRDFYTACRDFRLLQVIPDSVVGRTPQQIYSFLGALQSNVLTELRNEASADEIMARLIVVRETAVTPLDKRACDLLEAMVERRSSEVLNQPGPHVDAAVAALTRAFDREWADGEIQQMSEFLNGMGTISQEKLADERLRQLRALHQMTTAGTDARLIVAWHLSHSLFHSHGRKDEAIATMEIAIREFDQTHSDGWPARMNTQLDGYLGLLEAVQQYARAESVVLAQLKKPETRSQELWLRLQRNEVLLGAFRNKGQVSLGQGDELYRNLWQHLLVEAEVPNDNHQYQVLNSFNQFFRQARDHRIASYKTDLRTFAFEQFPELIRNSSNQYRNLVSGLQQTVRDLLGPEVGLEFLIARCEEYPARLEYTYENAWQQFGHQLAQYRLEAKKLGDISELEERLLVIALRELRRDLLTRQARNRSMFHKGNSDFWGAKAEEFLRVAEDVYRERSQSGRSVTYIANFLFHDVGRQDRAIEIMLIAHSDGVLSAGQQIQVCQWLHLKNRHAESIPLLESLVREYAKTMQYRTMLITAYGHSNRKQQMEELLAETDEYFRRPGLWTEWHMAQLAECCFHNDLYQQCVSYYDEAISLHQRTQPNRGIGNSTFSAYYSEQGRAYAGLGDTIRAVDAAAAGVIAWGPYQSQRSSSLHWLRQVIKKSKDLDGYVKHLDEQVAETGTDSPLIRKMVGLVYADRKAYVKAETQLALAIELQPNDSEAQEALIKSYEALGNQDAVVNQMLAMLDFDRHNLELYKRLAERLKNDEPEAERAATTIVEAAPSEAEHHQALAEFRQAQNRWSDAIPHWHHVAELRALEPTGLLHLAEAQIHEQRWEDAQTTLDTLNRSEWPSRFSDVTNQVRELQQRIPNPVP